MIEAILYKKSPKDDSIRCNLCSHYCNIPNMENGKCGVRQNLNGTLYSLNYGRVQGFAIDPIEKKPLYHFYPGSKVISFGLPGCNFHCFNCQNSDLSQNVKLDKSILESIAFIKPLKFISQIENIDALGIAYTYSEPTIFFEYVYDVIKLAREHPKTNHYKHVLVSNGFFSTELVDLIIEEKLIDAMNIDLKFSNDKSYKTYTGGSLEPIISNIRRLIDAGIHIEITNLVMSDINDSVSDLIKISEIIMSISPKIPLHFSRFFPRYKMTTTEPTNISTLQTARKIALEAGIGYVYIGNTVSNKYSNTYCSKCGKICIERDYSRTILKYNIENRIAFCKSCNNQLDITL